MYYINTLYPLQDKVLRCIDGLNTPFYLTGGTALSRNYFNYRYSDDLDFFVNNNPDFQKLAEDLVKSLGGYKVDVRLRAETFYSLLVEDILKVDLVNDVASHIGGFEKGAIFSNIDTVTNILSNKISAVYSRDEPKDVVDIWMIAKSGQIDWKQIFEDVTSKAVGLFPPLIAERLETFPVELIEKIKWVDGKKPDNDEFKKDINKIIQEILNIGGSTER